MESRARILLVEDDLNLGYVIKDNLTEKGFEISLCEDGEKAIDAFESQEFDLCILDIMLPKIDGFSVAEKIRSTDQETPILFLSAKSMKEDKINGFKIGGDDYITKPFSIEELVLRVEVFIKRSGGTLPAQPSTFEIGAFTFDHSNLLLANGDNKRTLTQKESDILHMFCSKPGIVLKREEILNKVWGDDDYFLGRSLDVFISKLRKYLREDSSLEIINYHGVGFKLDLKTT